MARRRFVLPITSIVEITAETEEEAQEIAKAWHFGSTTCHVGGESGSGRPIVVGHGSLEEVPRHVFTEGPPPGGY